MNIKKIAETTIAFLAGVGFLYAGIAIFVWDVEKLRQARDSQNWPRVEGRVILSTVDRSKDEIEPHVVYTYIVAGTLYESRQISFDIFDKPGGRGLPESIVARYPVEKEVTVYYKPDEAGIAILEPGIYSPFLMPLVFGALFLAGGSLLLWRVFRPVTLKEKPDPHPGATVRYRMATTVAMSVLIYAIIVLTSFESAAQEIFIKAFGERPAGMPNLLFMLALQTLLYLPMPWVFWHGMRLAFQANEDGRRYSVWYMLTIGRRHKHLRRSQLACIAGLVYFIVICAAWIIYTAALGI
jgi:hypothetical protein